MIFGMRAFESPSINDLIQEDRYNYVYCTDEELQEIRQFSPELADKYIYRYNINGVDSGFVYCPINDFLAVDTTGELYTILLGSELFHFNSFMASNRPGHQI